MQRSDLLLGDQRSQVGRIFVALGAGDDQTCAREQRPEELPDRHVEAVGCLLQNAIRRRQLISVLHPQEPIHNSPMDIQHSFGLSGRT